MRIHVLHADDKHANPSCESLHVEKAESLFVLKTSVYRILVKELEISTCIYVVSFFRWWINKCIREEVDYG